MRANLYPQWLRLTEPLCVDFLANADIWAHLQEAYGDPRRHYHNLDHVAEVLAIIDDMEDLAADPIAVKFAAWFHDVIYDPKSSDNEERSADHAARVLAEWGGPHLIEPVRSLILATKTHGPTSDADTAVLLDADLAILGAVAERYSEYAEAIRREYAFVADAEYRRGRVAVLRRFLERSRIYLTAPMLDAREDAARRNIATEIMALESAQSGQRSKTQ